jgi:hypothetical protein
LTRIEGVLNLVADRVSGLMVRMDRHDSEIGSLKATTQTLREQAVARDATALALAAALKEADESRRTKDTQTWSPFAKTITVIVAFTSIAAVLVYYLHH